MMLRQPELFMSLTAPLSDVPVHEQEEILLPEEARTVHKLGDAVLPFCLSCITSQSAVGHDVAEAGQGMRMFSSVTFKCRNC